MFPKHNDVPIVFKLVSGLLITVTLSCSAEVVTDGSLGARVELPGKHFQITPKLGQQLGGNLFHSFQTFNLSADEAATFSGATSVQNVIARVTGGSPSQIDGLIRSTIPNADLYLINPYGVMFGPNAKLDLQGGFHVSTADYLKLQDGGRFDARTPNNSLLSVAPVTAFGFLTDSPAPITTQDSILSVAPMRPLSLIGGNLQLQGSIPVQFDDLNTYATLASSLLHTAGGQINLVAVGSSGEVMLSPDLTLTGRGGDITLNRTLIDTSGLGSGNLKIRGGRLEMHDSTLQANTLGEFDGGLMDIQLTKSLQVNSTLFYFNALTSTALGQGKGSGIAVKVPELSLNRTLLRTSTLTEADAGDIDVNVTRLNLFDGAGVMSNSILGSGKGGQLTIHAAESVLISGHSVGARPFGGIVLTDFPSLLDSTNFSTAVDSRGSGNINVTAPRIDLVGGQLSSSSFGKGNAGNLVIQADNVNVTEGGIISTSAFDTGAAGNIQLNVTDTLFISGQRNGTFTVPVINQRFENNQSSITSFSMTGIGGQIDVLAKTVNIAEKGSITTASFVLGYKASDINLRADKMLLTEGGSLSSSSGFYAGQVLLLGNGIGGDIHVRVKQLSMSVSRFHLQSTGIFSDTYGLGSGGNIFVEADSLDISGHDVTITASSYDVGNAGQVNLQVQQLLLREHGSISTAAAQAGGGDVVINGLSKLLYLDNSEIATSVTAGQGNGGNITIEQPQFIAINHGQIKAQADAGHGGNISVTAEHFIPSSDSLISASSNLGIDGSIVISSPTEDVGNEVLSLSTNFINAADLFPRSCAARIADQRPSQFVRPFTLVIKPHFRNDAPEDSRPSHSSQSNIEAFSQK